MATHWFKRWYFDEPGSLEYFHLIRCRNVNRNLYINPDVKLSVCPLCGEDIEEAWKKYEEDYCSCGKRRDG